MKDAAWAPAVESFLGFGTLNSFCVDNSQDAKLLNSIMKEIFYNESTLQVICSKFFNQVKENNFYYFEIKVFIERIIEINIVYKYLTFSLTS